MCVTMALTDPCVRAFTLLHLLYARSWERCSERIQEGSCPHGHGTYDAKVLIDIQQNYISENFMKTHKKMNELQGGRIMRGSI